jgi:hypothetical protein
MPAALTAHVGFLITAVPTIVVQVTHPAFSQASAVLTHKLIFAAGVVLGDAGLAVTADDQVTALAA